MNKLLITLLAATNLCTASVSQATAPSSASQQRGMYVGQFNTILGDASLEKNLLEYAKKNKITYLSLYSLDRDIIGNDEREKQLSSFIVKAKRQYGILEIGAALAGKDFFGGVNEYNANHHGCFTKEGLEELYPELSDILNNTAVNLSLLHSFFCYNTSHLGKFDVLNTEFEYWNEADRQEAFENYLDVLTYVNTLRQGASSSIKVESYLGWPSENEVRQIVPLLDRVLLHAYRSSPEQSYDYTRTRLSYFGSQGKKITVYPIFSAEKDFMGAWLNDNSLAEAEEFFQTDFAKETADWKKNIDLGGYQWFTYAEMSAYKQTNGIRALLDNGTSTISQCYPNPTDKTVSMDYLLKDASLPTFLQVVDQTGKLQHFERVRDIQGRVELDVSQYAPGTYYYSLITNKDATKWQSMVVLH